MNIVIKIKGGIQMSNQTLIFGHKNPDTDSIMSSMVMANLEKQLGNDAKAVRLGNHWNPSQNLQVV